MQKSEIKELLSREDLYYRGYDSRYGVFDSKENYSFTWITDDAEYALEYIPDKLLNKIAVIKLLTDEIGDVFSLDEYADLYEPTEKEMHHLYKRGFWGYGFDDGKYYIVCVNKTKLKVMAIVEPTIFSECLHDLYEE